MNSTKVKLALSVVIGMIVSVAFLTGTQQTIVPPSTATAQPRSSVDGGHLTSHTTTIHADVTQPTRRVNGSPSRDYFERRFREGRMEPEEGACLRSCLHIRMECIQAVMSERFMNDEASPRVAISPSLQSARDACEPEESLCIATCPYPVEGR